METNKAGKATPVQEWDRLQGRPNALESERLRGRDGYRGDDGHATDRYRTIKPSTSKEVSDSPVPQGAVRSRTILTARE